MISFLKQLVSNRGLEKDLLAFLQEMEKNLEIFYVTDQRQFITEGFVTGAWPRVKDRDVIKRHEAIGLYVRRVEEINALHNEQKEFEKWYSSSMDNKTPDNARKLHGMKQDLQAKIKTMEPVIIRAGQALEKELVDMGVLKA